jgi:putative N6-adenine-specific DNA methylase
VRCFAVAAPGLEGVLAAELGALPATSAHTVLPGGVEFDAEAEGLARANLWLRTATRVVVRLGELEARDFAKLRRRAAALPWERFFAPGQRPEMAITVRRCRLYHTGAIAERLEGAIADRLGAPLGGEPLGRVVVRGEDDRFALSVDASGELLHRRGWRTEAGEAPLRETLAAAILALAGWQPGEPLVDPTCGSGTLVIEAATRAVGRAPGLARGCAFERWPGHDPALLARLRAEAEAAVLEAPAAGALRGNDADEAMVALAQRNAERAGVASVTAFTVGPAERLALDGPPGLVVANPPYGHRLEAELGLFRALGARARAAGWRLAVLAGDVQHLRAAGKPRATFRLQNGGLPVQLGVYDSR